MCLLSEISNHLPIYGYFFFNTVKNNIPLPFPFHHVEEIKVVKKLGKESPLKRPPILPFL